MGSYPSLTYHIVFGTKFRRPLIANDMNSRNASESNSCENTYSSENSPDDVSRRTPPPLSCVTASRFFPLFS